MPMESQGVLLTTGQLHREATLLIWRILYRVPRVRIPPSPPVLLGFFRSESLFYEPASVPVSGRVGIGWA